MSWSRFVVTPGTNNLFVSWGQTFLICMRVGHVHFSHTGNILCMRGGDISKTSLERPKKNFGGCGGFDDVDEGLDVSKVVILLAQQIKNLQDVVFLGTQRALKL